MSDATRDPEAELDRLFAAARAGGQAVPPALAARILADADLLTRRRRPVRRPAQGLLARILDTLGGWPAVSGLAACALAGFWLGFAGPETVSELPGLAGLTGDETALAVDDGVGGLMDDELAQEI